MRRVARLVGDQGDDGRASVRANPPQVQVGDAVICLGFDGPLHITGQLAIRHAVQQHPAGFPNEANSRYPEFRESCKRKNFLL